MRPQFNQTSDLDGTWFYIGAYLTSGKRNDVTSQILGLAMLEVKFWYQGFEKNHIFSLTHFCHLMYPVWVYISLMISILVWSVKQFFSHSSFYLKLSGLTSESIYAFSIILVPGIFGFRLIFVCIFSFVFWPGTFLLQSSYALKAFQARVGLCNYTCILYFWL